MQFGINKNGMIELKLVSEGIELPNVTLTKELGKMSLKQTKYYFFKLKKKQYKSDLVWFGLIFCLMAYQPSWVILMPKPSLLKNSSDTI